MAFEKLTEQTSPYRHLEKMTVAEILNNINREDSTVPAAVAKAIPQIEKLVDVVSDKMLSGGRMFYIGLSLRDLVLNKVSCSMKFFCLRRIYTRDYH